MIETTLQFTREINASAHSIWRCWTEPELLKQWFAPKPVVTTEAVIEPHSGGCFNTTMVVPDMPKPMMGEGCVLAADPGKRFAFTNMMKGAFQPQDTSGEGQFPFTADITIKAHDTGCTYTVTVRHLNKAGADAHRDMGFFEGWGTAADQMAALAETLS
ncbi:SRPBCC domain-containing protein [Yoonia sp. F2084L]|uniref:SRPBCC domain-containing protein n=1 Tax=Yoonia sp. F2084L TaxID=2926419 RepID=UPI001FF3C769|nr:SRPBCC domain-containing protein [Yoonia sp. F2084L]MCK0095251.1 SRPBCC domain-containing protein [Yoonia sp. F2084L]